MSMTWLDIETTGLDPFTDLILEVALVVTDDNLNVRATWTHEVGWDTDLLDDAHRRMDDVVKEMHKSSGLWGDIRYMKHPSPRIVEDMALEFLREMVGDEKLPIAGNSVSFDRAFLSEHMKRLLAAFHYRNIDVSSVRELARRWRPDLGAREPKGLGRHRALPDLIDSINLLKFYRDNFMLVDPNPYDPNSVRATSRLHS